MASTRLPALGLEAVRRLSALACLAGAYQSAVTGFELRWLAVTVGGAVIVATTGQSHWAPALPLPPRLGWPARTQLWSRLAPAWALMALAGGLKAFGGSPAAVNWTWLTGALWLLVGTWTMPAERPAPGVATTNRWAWVFGIAVVGVAAALRFWDLDTVPRYVNVDEGTVSIVGQRFLSSPERDWFGVPPKSGQYTIMYLFYALAGLDTWLLGSMDVWTARLSDALIGCLSVALVFYGLVRVSTLRVAVVSALLLAANHSHIAHSRIAVGNIQPALVAALAFAILSRLWTAPTFFNAALLGLAVGLGMQTYPPSLLVLPLLAITLLVLGVLNPQLRRALLVPIAVAAITCATAAAPFGVTSWQYRDAMTYRSRDINILSPRVMERLKKTYRTDSTAEVLVGQAKKALLVFHRGRDASPQYGINHPMADRYTAAILVAGAVMAVWGLRQFVATNALVFAIGYAWFAIGMHIAPSFKRTTGALPAAMILAAIGLVQCCAMFWGERRWWTRRLCDVSVLAAVALIVTANAQIYFVEHWAARKWGDHASEAGWVAQEYGDRYTVHLASWKRRGNEQLRLMTASLPAVVFNDTGPALEYIAQVEPTGADLFLIHGENPAAQEFALQHFPQARTEIWRRDPKFGPKLFLVFVDDPALASVAATPTGDEPTATRAPSR